MLLHLIIIFVLLIILNTILSIIIYRDLKNILINLNEKIEACRFFINENDGIFSILFMFIFALEQGILIIITHLVTGEDLKLIIGLFSLIIITTASLQKFILQKKREYEKEKNYIIKRARNSIEKLLLLRK